LPEEPKIGIWRALLEVEPGVVEVEEGEERTQLALEVREHVLVAHDPVPEPLPSVLLVEGENLTRAPRPGARREVGVGKVRVRVGLEAPDRGLDHAAAVPDQNHQMGIGGRARRTSRRCPWPASW
jgi:hypothetical protein